MKKLAKLKHIKPNFIFIDLFSGIGGMRIALESKNLKCVYSSEWDKYAQQTYNENFGEIPEGDITKKNEKDIPPHDILCGGFPCQAFSIAGKQEGFADTRGTLFFDIVRIVKYHKPKILLLENVKNLLTHDNNKTFDAIIKTLTKLNYNCYYEVLNAGNFGVPQQRKRLIIVGFKKNLNIKDFEFTKTLNCATSLYTFLEKQKKVTDKYVVNCNNVVRYNIKIEKDSSGHYPQKCIRIGTINKGGQGERVYSSLGHSITLSAHGGGLGAKTGLYLINKKVRRLTPRECANIMGFPKNFKIPVSNAQAYKQFGNSVAIPVIKSVITDIMNKF